MLSFPYSYYRCSCTSGRSSRGVDAPTVVAGQNGQDDDNDGDDDDVEDQNETFDPSSPKSNFNLYLLDSLMWCEECYDMRCPRCTVEEIVCWYCPNCLFEVPSSTVRSEGNRCTRNCFNCPECTASLSINTLDPDPNSTGGPFILLCNYCSWNSMDIGMKFNAPRYIYNQLQQQTGGGSGANGSSTAGPTSGSAAQRRLPSSRLLETVPEPGPSGSDLVVRKSSSSREPSPNAVEERKLQGPVARFNALKTFYKTQLNSSAAGDALFSSDLNYGSPGHLARVLAMYSSARSSAAGGGGAGRLGSLGAASKPVPVREAADVSEGLSTFSPELDELRVRQSREQGWQGTATGAQLAEQRGVTATAGGSGVRFLADLRPVATLLRTKRSSRCRACRHILVKPEAKVSSTRYRIKLAATEHVPRMALMPLDEQQHYHERLNLDALPPSRTLQFLLKVTNPMFDMSIKVTLATPAETPAANGSGGSRVTILCPQFDVGAEMDVWDEALRGGKGGKSGIGDGDGKVAEAGKVWERGRNWTSVVVEVVPKRLQKKTEELNEDEDVLEIPIFVRLEYESQKDGEEAPAAPKEARKRKDVSYWTVLGVGRIATESLSSLPSSA